MPERNANAERVYRGIPVSGGVCRGKLLVLGQSRAEVPRHDISEPEVPREIHRLETALIATRQQLLEVQRRVEQAMGAADASIFDAHLLVLEDRMLIDEVTRKISEQHVNAEHAFNEVAQRYMKTLSAIEDDYLRERAADMRDVSSRVLNNLTGSEQDELKDLKEPCIIIGHDLSPSMTAQFDRKYVLGFATDIGSQTSHTAIMARSMGIPAIVGLRDASTQLRNATFALLDGYNGVLIINPTDQTLFEYGQLIAKRVNLQEKLRDTRDHTAVTLDGSNYILSANIEGVDDIAAVRESGAEGVGLFRTEYLFIHREILPTEEEQFVEYKAVAEGLSPNPVVIRTLDLGGDKFLAQLNLPTEMNPFLGWRAIRFCLQEKHIFKAQLRAILRASAFGNVKMMYPMISGAEELDQANAVLEECRQELIQEGQAFNPKMEVGAMIEIPSAVMVADALAERVQFFSLGTNDLIQYSLAVDRLNERIAHLYEPTHPAVLRLIELTVRAAHEHGIWVGVCGEMAGDPVLAPLLLGLGVDELSASPGLVAQVKFIIRRVRMDEARKLAEFALKQHSAKPILEACRELAHRIAPALFENDTCIS